MTRDELRRSLTGPSPARACTCHPDDTPPQPCPQQYAYNDCVGAARDALALQCMTSDQFELSMQRWISRGQPLDQPTLSYIAAIYREIRE